MLCIVDSGGAVAGSPFVAAPVSVTVDPSGKFAYVANTSSNNVSAFTIDVATGALTAVVGSPFAAGASPTSVTVHPGKFAYVANVGSKNVSVFTINAATGALTAVPRSPFTAGMGPFSVTVDPSGKFAYVANVSSNNVSAFTIKATTGALTAVAGSPFAAGTAPRSVTVDPSGKFAYVANAGSKNVSAFTINAATGALTAVAGSPFAAGASPFSVTVDPSGKFAYVANLSSNNVSAFTINAATGAPTVIAGSPFAAGANPSSVTVDPSGKFAYVANVSSNNVSAFTINAATGALTAIAGSPFAAGTAPSSVTVDPSGKFAYVANQTSNNVSTFIIDATSGALTTAGTVAIVAFQEMASKSNPQAREQAEKLGRERSAAGLQSIIAAHDADLMAAYDRGFRETSMRVYTENKPNRLPADVEALIVKHYHDPQLGYSLRRLIFQNGTRYQTRAFFDLLHADWRSGKEKSDVIFQTDLAGIEAPLLETLRPVNPSELSFAFSLVGFLAERKYRPAVPVLIPKGRDAKPGSELAMVVHNALLRIGTREASDAVLRRLAWLRVQPPGPEVTMETERIIGWIDQAPVDTPLDFAAFRKALPTVLSDNVKSSLLSVIGRRKERQGVPDALGLLADIKQYPRNLETLIAFDSPDVWKQARAEIERLKQQGVLNDGAYRWATSLLDAKIANPEKHFADKKQLERQKEFDAKQSVLYATRNALQQGKDAQSEQYVAASLGYLRKAEQLAQNYTDLPTSVVLRNDMGSYYLSLGNLVRFKLKQTERALELYASAQRLGDRFAAFAIADTYQFDLRDKAKALAEYQRLLEQQRHTTGSSNDMDAGLANWARTWLVHQIEYLKTGKSFSGTIGQDDIGSVGLLFHFGAGGTIQDDYLGLARFYRALMEGARGEPGAQQLDRDEMSRMLETLPASGLTLGRTVRLLTLMPDADAILHYLDRHDPAGYASASFFATVDFMDRQADAGRETAMLLPGLALPPAGPTHPLRAAAARFVKERKISLKTEADARMSSPQNTWNLFIASLKSGDLDTAMSCLTPGMQVKFRPSFTQMSPEKLRNMAESFSGFSLSASMGQGMREAVVARGKRVGFIYFINVGGAWKINEM
jgi:DNA-binding beta-propeller fold protein YncE/tetratricopeptide (TPR) repeat protein